MKKLALAMGVALALAGTVLQAKTVSLTLTAQEVDLPIDNKGTMYRSWTFGGQVPGPVLRVTEGDVVEFTLTNDKANKNSHSIDLHAARVDVLKEFEAVKPGETKKFSFKATFPGTFFYHCGSDPMIQHIARGMYGVIIVDPLDASTMPKADREYVLIQSELYKNPDDQADMMANKWTNVMFNGGIFKYDPVHDPAATRMVQATPGERVRTEDTPAELRNKFCITDDDVQDLARQSLVIEKHYGRPMDIEWGKDGTDGKKVFTSEQAIGNRDEYEVVTASGATATQGPALPRTW